MVKQGVVGWDRESTDSAQSEFKTASRPPRLLASGSKEHIARRADHGSVKKSQRGTIGFWKLLWEARCPGRRNFFLPEFSPKLMLERLNRRVRNQTRSNGQD